jgi:hypothetical protein
VLQCRYIHIRIGQAKQSYIVCNIEIGSKYQNWQGYVSFVMDTGSNDLIILNMNLRSYARVFERKSEQNWRFFIVIMGNSLAVNVTES